MNLKSLLFFAVVAIFTLVPTSEAVCANQAVYDQCKTTGNNQLTACANDDWSCKCNANTALQNCYLQCPDDPTIQTEGEAYRPSVQQACSLAASQSSAKAQATPTVAPAASAPPVVPTAPPTSPSPSPQAASSAAPSQTPTGTPKANSATNASDMIAAVPLIVAVTIMNFLIGQSI